MGRHMLDVMERRGIPTWRALSERIASRTGARFGPARISNWAYGRHPASLEFARAFGLGLDLSPEERAEWHEAFLMGHDAYDDEAARPGGEAARRAG
jgi:hypothetical protein